MLRGLRPKTVRPLLVRLREDTSPAVAAAAGDVGARQGKRRLSTPPPTPPSWLETPLPDDPQGWRRYIATAGASAPLPALHSLVEQAREREGLDPARGTAWRTARAAAHLALAGRGSRLALYDLRESLDGAKEPLPVEFLAALERIGDTSCLEPIASALVAAPADAEWWREHLAHAFRAIVTRERVTSRHAVMKKIARRWPEASLRLEAGG
jgi:hypothetical protein